MICEDLATGPWR